jgi:hypothetical protein
MTSRPAPVPSSELWDLVVDRDWPRVIEHVQEYPHDAEYVDGHYDESVLYLCCQHSPPLEAIQAVRRAHPQAVAIKNTRGHRELPLHIACRYQLSVKILEELVQEDPSTTVVNSRIGLTPIMELWESRRRQQEWRQQQQQYEQRREDQEADNNNNDNADARTVVVVVALEDDDGFWDKMLVLLRAVARHRQDQFLVQSDVSFLPVCARPAQQRSLAGFLIPTNDGNDEHLVVHAAVWLSSYGCPIQVVHYVIQRFPIQVRTRDSSGKLPLQIAVGPAPFQESMRRRYLPRGQELLAALLDVYPEAAQIPLCCGNPASTSITELENYRYPLMVALHNRHMWTSGVEDLVCSAPAVLLLRDPLTKLYPFQLAAIPSGDTANVDLGTIYELLRAQPQVMNLLDFSAKRTEYWRFLCTENIPPPPLFVALVCILTQFVVVTVWY